MKLTYDPKYNIAYLSLKATKEQVTTIHLSDDVKVDIAPDGTLYGIELLNANAQLAADGDVLAILNEATGERASVKLAG